MLGGETCERNYFLIGLTARLLGRPLIPLDDALPTGSFQIFAHLGGLTPGAERADQSAVIDALIAEVGAFDDRRTGPQHRRELALQRPVRRMAPACCIRTGGRDIALSGVFKDVRTAYDKAISQMRNADMAIGEVISLRRDMASDALMLSRVLLNDFTEIMPLRAGNLEQASELMRDRSLLCIRRERQSHIIMACRSRGFHSHSPLWWSSPVGGCGFGTTLQTITICILRARRSSQRHNSWDIP